MCSPTAGLPYAGAHMPHVDDRLMKVNRNPDLN